MKLLAVILIFSIMLPLSGLYALPPMKNTEIFESYTRIAAADLADFIDSHGIKKVVLKAEPAKTSWLVTNPLLTRLSEKTIAILEFDSTGINAELNVFVRKAEVVYELFQDDDSLTRKVSFKVESILKFKGALLPVTAFERIFSDVVSRDDIAAIEDKNFEYTRGIVPERDDWFYRNIIEPAIVVGTAAITLILLFTVRSQ